MADKNTGKALSDLLVDVAEAKAESGQPVTTSSEGKTVLPVGSLDESNSGKQRRGRRKGKRSDPNYTQTGVYLPKDLTKRIKQTLYGSDLDFSDLIAELLAEWEQKHKAEKNS